jgi:putative ABC transport system ATP-binding protein
MYQQTDTLAPLAPADRGPAIVARDLTRHYGEGASAVEALRGVSAEIAAGALTVVMGPSGSGKSTLMHLLAGLDRPTGGTVDIGGRELGALDDKQLTLMRRREIGFVFQAYNLLPVLTAEENIVLPLELAGRKPDRGHVDEVIERLGLSDRRDHRPAQLSGGQQQRVAVARALVCEPAVLFADEPTGNLDSVTGRGILTLLREAVDTFGQTTVMVTHDPAAAAMGDRVLFIADGELVRDLERPGEQEILDVMKEVSR